MPRYVTRESVVLPGSVVVPEWVIGILFESMSRSMRAHQVVSTTHPSEIAKGATEWGARMGESTICAANLACAINLLQNLKDEQ